jgi:HEAT repeat protein
MLKNETDHVVLADIASFYGKFGSEDNTAQILELLKHPDHRVRANACEAAGNLQLKKVFKNIILLLRDEDNRVRANAAKAVKNTNPDLTAAALEEMMRSGEIQMQDSAIYCLPKSNLPQAAELLILGLEDPKEIIKNKCIKALRHFGVNLEPENKASQADIESDHKADHISDHKADHSPDEDSGPDSLAAKDAKTEDAPPVHLEDIDKLTKEEPEDMDPLDSSDFKVRLEHIVSLGQKDNKDNIEACAEIIDHLSREEDNHVISASLISLAKIGFQGAINTIKPYLEQGDLRVRANAIEALGIFDIPDFDELIIPFLKHSNHRLAANALVALRNNPAIEHAKILRKMTDSNDPLMKKAALHAIKRLDNGKYKNLAKRLAGDFDSAISGLAREVSKTINSEEKDFQKRNTLNAAELAGCIDEGSKDMSPAGTDNITEPQSHAPGPADQIPDSPDSQDTSNSDISSGSADLSDSVGPGDSSGSSGSSGSPDTPDKINKFNIQKYKNDIASWAPAFINKEIKSLTKELETLKKEADKLYTYTGISAIDDNLETTDKFIKKIIDNLTQMRKKSFEMKKRGPEMTQSHGSFFSKITKSATNAASSLLKNFDKKLMDSDLNSEYLHLGKTLAETGKNPFSPNSDAFDEFKRLLEMVNNISIIEQKLATLNSGKK